MSPKEYTRRDFVQTAAYTAGAVMTAGGLLAPAQLVSAAPQMDRKLRWGIIGAGNRGRGHMKVINDNRRDNEIVAMCDIRDEAFAVAEKEIGKKTEHYHNYKEMLAKANINTVLITTPTYLHKEMAIASLNKGYDVLCEKPLGINTQECTDIINVWLRTDCVLGNGIQLRYHPLYERVHEMVTGGAIGDLKYIWAVEFRGDWASKSPDPIVNQKINYMYYEYQSGGTANNKNVHDFDIFNWLTGRKALRCAGFGGSSVYQNRETHDHYTSIIEYEGGVKATMGLVLFNYGYHDTVLVGDAGKLMFQRGGMQITQTGRSAKDKVEDIVLSEDKVDIHGHGGTVGLHNAFIKAVKNREPVLTGPFVGRDAVMVADAIQISMKEGRMVECQELL